MEQYGFDPIYEEDEKKEESNIVKIEKKHNIYDEPIYELTEENTSEKCTPKRSRFSPKETSMDERYSNTLFTNTLNKGRKLLIITIEIGSGKQEQLVIYENDNPQEVAEEFCNKHNYEKELRDMLQYQIEYTIYETKSKLIQKEKSKTFSANNSQEAELEIPLEMTYSDNGMYSKLSPKNEGALLGAVNYSSTNEKIEEATSEYFNQNINENSKNIMRLKDEEKVEDNEENYQEYGNNIPESGKKYIEQEENMKLNIETHPQDEEQKNSDKPSKLFMKNIAQKYLEMRSQFKPTLTDKTKELALFKINSDDPVHDRLHDHAQTKQVDKTKQIVETKKKSREVVSAKMKPDFIPLNHGERLYQRSRVKKERLSRRAQKEKRQKEDAKVAKNSFKPKINETAQKYYKRSYKNPIPDCLYEANTFVENKKKQLREEQQKKDEEEQTFVPKLNRISQEISANKFQRQVTVHDHLFLDATSKCQKIEQETSKISEEQEKMSKLKRLLTSTIKSKTIDELVNSKMVARAEIEKFREEQSFPFHPTISRSPLRRSETEDMPLHDRLIADGVRLKESKEHQKEEISKFTKRHTIQTTSTDMLEDKKKYILGNVFEVLDNDSDGYVSSGQCDFSALNTELRSIFKPLIDEIEDKNVRLNREEFIDCSLRLYKRLTPTQRGFLIETGKVSTRKVEEESYSFRPMISLRSQELAKASKNRASSIILNSNLILQLQPTNTSQQRSNKEKQWDLKSKESKTCSCIKTIPEAEGSLPKSITNILRINSIFKQLHEFISTPFRSQSKSNI